MKKIISILLAMTLVVSCFAVIPVMAEDATITISTEATTVLSGYKVKVSATASVEGKINFYCNDALVVANSAESETYVTAQAGVNTVYAELVDDNGNVLATSAPATFNAYSDTFKTALHRDCSTTTFPTHNKHVTTSTEYKDFGVIGHENDNTTFASDSNHQNVLKLSSGLKGEYGCSINVLTYYGGRKPNATTMANAGRLYAQSIDVYPENISKNEICFRAYYPSSNKREDVLINAFKFGAEEISVATNLAGTAFVTIPYEQDNWYTAKVIYDPMAGKIMLAVNDVIYSVIDESATNRAPLALNSELQSNYLYLDIILYGSDAEAANVVYLDNHDFTYSELPEISVSTDANTVVSGYKVKVSATASIDGKKYNYYCNDALVVSNSTDSEAYVTAKSGVNTVYAELVDDSGAVLATSAPATFNAYSDIFETVLHRDGSESTFALHNKHIPTSTEYKDYGVIEYENNTTQFATDANHQNVLKLSSGVAGTVGNLVNVITYYGGRKPNSAAMANASRLYTQSIDVYPENITANSFRINFYYPSSQTRETSFANAFVFGVNEISIATVRGGASKITIPYEQDRWYTATAIFDPIAKKIMLAVNGVIYSVIDESANAQAPLALNNELASNYLYYDLTLYGSNAEAANVVYLDNNDFAISSLPEISISTNTSTVVSGYKVKVNAEHKLVTGKINYYCNGVLVKGNTTDKEAYVTADAGVNEVYAELLDEYGTVVAISDEVTFNAYSDVFDKVVYNRSGSTSVLNRHGKHNGGVDDPYGVNVWEDDSTTFAQDEKHGTVLKLASSVATTDKSPLINVLSVNRTHSALASAQRLYSMSIDVYPESVKEGAFSFANAVATKGSADKYMYFFKIASGKILVSTNGSNFTDCVEIPCEKKWYTLKVILDPIEEKYIVAVNDVIYSIVDKFGTNDAPKASNTGNLYYDITLNGSKDADNPNVVYVDNLVVSYSTIPTHSPVKYINGGSVVTNRDQISNENDLKVNFVLNKGEFANVTCIATVLENNGELVCLATQDVTFTEEKTSENVSLTLTNLPDSIATGGYTVNVMLWDKVTQTPIVTKVVLPN
ncbi:MAG: hypothetical protein E7394_02795 [Ruminococcaceae bacterium]|nr:hypothetical protein [Oscillospiraceae bacterium]